MTKSMLNEISQTSIAEQRKPESPELLTELPSKMDNKMENVTLSQDNDQVKSLMADELIEIGISKKTAYQILNIRDGVDR